MTQRPVPPIPPPPPGPQYLEPPLEPPLEQPAAEGPAPLADWPPPEILQRWEVRRGEDRHRRSLRRRLAAAFVVVALIAVGVVLVNRGPDPGVVGSRTTLVEPVTGTLAWTVDSGSQRFVAVVSAPAEGSDPLALAIPGETLVDIPGGPASVGEAAAADTGLLMAAAQATLDRRVDHFLATDADELAPMVDALGPVEVQTEAAFVYQGEVFGPGPIRLSGGQVQAYLEGGTDDDRTGRWEEVLVGVLSAPADRWTGQIGLSDSDRAVRGVLAGAHGASVLELPTVPAELGGLETDRQAMSDLLTSRFWPPGVPLVRVVVLNGVADPAAPGKVAGRLAPHGYRVVAAQPSADTDVEITRVIAGGDGFLDEADQVQTLLGVGMVYVGPQPTGIADITVVVGKDFAGA